jgi:hypothetical protein
MSFIDELKHLEEEFVAEFVAPVEAETDTVEAEIAVKEIEAPHPNPIIALAIAQAAERLANESK